MYWKYKIVNCKWHDVLIIIILSSYQISIKKYRHLKISICIVFTLDSTVLVAIATLTGPLLLTLTCCGSTEWQLYDFVRREDDIHASERNMAMDSQSCTVLKRYIYRTKIITKLTVLWLQNIWEKTFGN